MQAAVEKLAARVMREMRARKSERADIDERLHTAKAAAERALFELGALATATNDAAKTSLHFCNEVRGGWKLAAAERGELPNVCSMGRVTVCTRLSRVVCGASKALKSQAAPPSKRHSPHFFLSSRQVAALSNRLSGLPARFAATGRRAAARAAHAGSAPAFPHSIPDLDLGPLSEEESAFSYATLDLDDAALDDGRGGGNGAGGGGGGGMRSLSAVRGAPPSSEPEACCGSTLSAIGLLSSPQWHRSPIAEYPSRCTVKLHRARFSELRTPLLLVLFCRASQGLTAFRTFTIAHWMRRRRRPWKLCGRRSERGCRSCRHAPSSRAPLAYAALHCSLRSPICSYTEPVSAPHSRVSLHVFSAAESPNEGHSAQCHAPVARGAQTGERTAPPPPSITTRPVSLAVSPLSSVSIHSSGGRSSSQGCKARTRRHT